MEKDLGLSAFFRQTMVRGFLSFILFHYFGQTRTQPRFASLSGIGCGLFPALGYRENLASGSPKNN